MSDHPAQNWRGKCGRGPSMEHPVSGGYCMSCEIVEKLEAERDRLKSDAAEREDKYLKMLTQRNYAQKELPRLKAETEKYRTCDVCGGIDSVCAKGWLNDKEKLQKDRDAWKAKADKMAEAIKILLKDKYWKIEGRYECEQALSDYEKES